MVLGPVCSHPPNSSPELERPAGRPTAMDANHRAMGPTLEESNEDEAKNLKGK